MQPVQSLDAERGLAGLMAEPAIAGMPVPTAAPVRVIRRQAARSPGLARLAHDVVRGAALLLMLNLFVVQVSIVRGHSMEPGIADGDRLVVDRLAYALGAVHRFDVVVLRYPRDPAVDFVKRVVALPGEKVRIERGWVLVDGQPLEGSFAYVADAADMPETMVPDGAYFVLGDNRPISCDSRDFGLVPADLLKGKVRARFWPPSRMAVF